MTICQADRRWSTILLGDGSSTIGRSGCLLVCMVESARLLAGQPNLLPPHANETCRQAGAFFGSALVVQDAARVLGLESPDDEKVKIEGDMADAVERALAKGHALIHVDHDSVCEDGDTEGDHFLLAVGFSTFAGEPLHVECYDPATGVPVCLSWPDLRATVRWGTRIRKYRGVSVRPLRVRA